MTHSLFPGSILSALTLFFFSPFTNPLLTPHSPLAFSKMKQTNKQKKVLRKCQLAVSSSQYTIYSSHLSYLVSANHHAMDITFVNDSRMLNQWAVMCLILTWESLQHSVRLRESGNSVVNMGYESTLNEFKSHLNCLFRYPPRTIMISLFFLESGGSHLEPLHLFFLIKMFFSRPLPILQALAQIFPPQRGLLCPHLYINGIPPIVPVSGSKARLIRILALLQTDTMTLFKCILSCTEASYSVNHEWSWHFKRLLSANLLMGGVSYLEYCLDIPNYCFKKFPHSLSLFQVSLKDTVWLRLPTFFFWENIPTNWNRLTIPTGRIKSI